ncbi:hypothetical protein AC579_5279 [Pseudocercospora musae]|uniref:Uncharacterized protein n=1 Tax=Pseudocercospora musae TaxID=113226 RepID=A0A139IQ76_9PEZI|nr:hypothetical protein AC579_5279 [Pseudocercospora musae]
MQRSCLRLANPPSKPSDETTVYIDPFVKKSGGFFFLGTLDNVQYTWDGLALDGDDFEVTSGIGANTSVTLKWLARKKKGPIAFK